MNTTGNIQFPTQPKVLVVDDDPLTVRLITHYLEPEGYRVIVASSGEEAWDLLTHSNHNFCTIITDRMMPGMGGTELARKVNAQPAFNRLPIIMVTSHAGKEEMIDAYKGGVFDFLLKPIDKELLLLVVQRAMMSSYC